MNSFIVRKVGISPWGIQTFSKWATGREYKVFLDRQEIIQQAVGCLRRLGPITWNKSFEGWQVYLE